MPGEEENRNFYLRHTYFEVHRRKVSFPLLFFAKKLQFFFVILTLLKGKILVYPDVHLSSPSYTQCDLI